MNDDDLAHVFTFGVLFGDFFDMSAQKSAILPFLISTFYQLVAKRHTQPQKHNHTTHNNQNELPLPYPPAASALSLHG
jgi:hypothetical protein